MIAARPSRPAAMLSEGTPASCAKRIMIEAVEAISTPANNTR
jgi:hypothetical protein